MCIYIVINGKTCSVPLNILSSVCADDLYDFCALVMYLTRCITENVSFVNACATFHCLDYDLPANKVSVRPIHCDMFEVRRNVRTLPIPIVDTAMPNASANLSRNQYAMTRSRTTTM